MPNPGDTLTFPNCPCCGSSSSSSSSSVFSSGTPNSCVSAPCFGNSFTVTVNGPAQTSSGYTEEQCPCSDLLGTFTLTQTNTNNERGGGFDCCFHYAWSTNWCPICYGRGDLFGPEWIICVSGPVLGVLSWTAVFHNWTNGQVLIGPINWTTNASDGCAVNHTYSTGWAMTDCSHCYDFESIVIQNG